MSNTMSDMLGMGITIQLRNMFSAPARAVVASSRGMTEAIMADTEKVNTGWRLMGAGAGMMFVGTGMLAFLGAIGKASLKSSSDLEIFRLQIRLLAKDATVGDSLFSQLTQFATKTPFTIPQVMAGARNLLAFGFSANRVLGELKLAGNWASMMSIPIDEAALVLGKIRSGAISYAMRSLQRLGVGYADIAAAGGPIDLKTMRTKKGADPEKFLEAVNKVLDAKFSGSMGLIMQTVPGMLTNMKDQMILMGATIGDSIKPQIKEVLKTVLTVFNPDVVMPFAHAVGEALSFVLHGVVLLLKPLGEGVIWFMRLVGQHPGIVRILFSVIALSGALLNLAGASLIILGIWQAISFVLASEATGVFLTMLSGAVTPLLAVGAAAVLLYNIFKNNFFGIADTARYFWNVITQVTQGVIALFSSMHNGVGYMSQSMVNSLQNAGLLGIVTQLFMVGFRLYNFVLGILDAFKVVYDFVSAFAAMILNFFIVPMRLAGDALLGFGQFLGFVNAASLVSSNWFHRLGVAIGTLISVFVLARTVTMLYWVGLAMGQAIVLIWNAGIWAMNAAMVVWNVATKAATLAQWALNVALDANPIGVVIMGIALLVAGLYAVIKYSHQITGWFNSIPGWAQVLLRVFVPFLEVGLGIARNWDSLKSIFVSTATIFQSVWTKVIDWVADKFDSLLAKLAPFSGMIRVMTGISLPTADIGPGAIPGRGKEFTKEQLANMNGQANNMAARLREQDARTDNTIAQIAEMAKKWADKPHPPVILKLDGKTIAKTVNKQNLGEATAGR